MIRIGDKIKITQVLNEYDIVVGDIGGVVTIEKNGDNFRAKVDSYPSPILFHFDNSKNFDVKYKLISREDKLKRILDED